MSVPDNGITPNLLEDCKVDNKLESITFTRGIVLRAMENWKTFIKWSRWLTTFILQTIKSESCWSASYDVHSTDVSVCCSFTVEGCYIVVPVYKKGASSDPSNYRPIYRLLDLYIAYLCD